VGHGRRLRTRGVSGCEHPRRPAAMQPR
jgi:hypothetical protein